jgi:uncharacterized protein YndB with AHSA1/START domain
MTTMADEQTAQTTQVYAVFIRATPEQVWDGITKPEFTQRYFYGSLIESTYERGAAYGGWSSDHSQQLVDGEVLEADPPRKLVTTWRALYDPDTAAEPHSRVTWELEPAGEHVTKLTVVHDRLEASPKTSLSVAGGWSYVLSGLKTLLETGEPLSS